MEEWVLNGEPNNTRAARRGDNVSSIVAMTALEQRDDNWSHNFEGPFSRGFRRVSGIKMMGKIGGERGSEPRRERDREMGYRVRNWGNRQRETEI